MSYDKVQDTANNNLWTNKTHKKEEKKKERKMCMLILHWEVHDHYHLLVQSHRIYYVL